MKSWICTKVTGIRWLDPVKGCALREGRVGDERVFGLDLPGPRLLVWATEAVIRTALAASENNASAKLTCESRKAGESLPSMLPSMSGYDHETALDGTPVEHDEAGNPKLAKTRKTGWMKNGSTLVDLTVTDPEEP